MHKFILSGILIHCTEANIIKYSIIHGSFVLKNNHLYYSEFSVDLKKSSTQRDRW